MAPSREVQGIIAWLARAGVPFKVTATWDDPALRIHTPGSYHYRAGTDGKGLAVDFAFLVPTRNSPQLRRIYNAFVPIRPLLAELLGPGDPGHDNHVHVAVPKGTFLAMPNDPNLPDLQDVMFFVPIVRTGDGMCTGYYVVSSKGEIHGHGPGAPYHGRSEVPT